MSGKIKLPENTTEAQARKRLGEIKRMNNGLNATIIRYHNSEDIDVRFEDGIVIKSTTYRRFEQRQIANPNIKYKSGISLQEYAIGYYLRQLGFIKIKHGEWKDRGFGQYELDFYHPTVNIAIEYDGGFHNQEKARKRDIAKNKKYEQLGVKLYRIRVPDCQTLNGNIVELQLSNAQRIKPEYYDCKIELELILLNHGVEFDDNLIDFVRDEEVIRNSYNDEYVNYYAKNRVGQTIWVNSAQQNATIIAYHDYSHVDIQFDDGTIVKNIQYLSFQKGTIRHPSKRIFKNHKQEICQFEKFSTNMMNCGMQATIVAYRNYDDIDIQFADGTIREHVSYYHFKEGGIAHPNLSIKEQERIGETIMMNCGMIATVIEYRKSYDIDIEFEDGFVAHNVNYHNFKRGNIGNPNIAKNWKKRIGESRIMNCGKRATIVAYRSCSDLDIQFEDGIIVYNKRYARFAEGKIGYPQIT